MPFTPHPLLDLDVTSRAETWRFDLLDRDLNRQGTLAVDRGKPPKIEHNSNRTIKRSLSGLTLSPREALDVNPLTDRVQPVMVLADGSEWPLGVFLFADWPRARTTAGLVPEGSLVDQGLLLDQPCPRNVSVPPGSDLSTVLRNFLGECRIQDPYIAPTGAKTSGSVATVYKAGTSWSTILAELAGKAGLYSPSFDHRGRCQVVMPPPAADGDETDVVYEAGGRIYDGSIVEADDTLTAPNRYVAVDTGSTETPVVGVYTIPADAPHSFQHRGYYVTRTVEGQGFANTAAAQAAARTAYLSERTVESITFATPPDPRHDLWTTITYRGAVYREQTWAMICAEGAPMTHEARRFYA